MPTPAISIDRSFHMICAASALTGEGYVQALENHASIIGRDLTPELDKLAAKIADVGNAARDFQNEAAPVSNRPRGRYSARAHAERALKKTLVAVDRVFEEINRDLKAQRQVIDSCIDSSVEARIESRQLAGMQLVVRLGRMTARSLPEDRHAIVILEAGQACDTAELLFDAMAAEVRHEQLGSMFYSPPAPPSYFAKATISSPPAYPIGDLISHSSPGFASFPEFGESPPVYEKTPLADLGTDST